MILGFFLHPCLFSHIKIWRPIRAPMLLLFFSRGFFLRRCLLLGSRLFLWRSLAFGFRLSGHGPLAIIVFGRPTCGFSIHFSAHIMLTGFTAETNHSFVALIIFHRGFS